MQKLLYCTDCLCFFTLVSLSFGQNIQNNNYNFDVTNHFLQDFQVNENAGGTEQYYPDLASDKEGNYIIVWYDYRNGDADIFAQRYTYNGIPIGTNFRVNDDQGSTRQSHPAIAVDSSGNFIIVWYDWKNNSTECIIAGFRQTAILNFARCC